MCVLSLIHTGTKSRLGSDVSRVITPRAISISQMSQLPSINRANASVRPSGDSAGFVTGLVSGVPTRPTSAPDRSNHANWSRVVAAVA